MKKRKDRTTPKPDAASPSLVRAWIYLVPCLGILWVWLSSLSFVPVPWPDDSAFYFPAKDLFSWPPRWVMIPQSPFEPSYREWNFNTMPLFPILIGIARLLGIDGSHGLKLLPLAGWFLSCFVILRAFRHARAPALFLAAAAVTLTFDPILRWSSVLLRPESLIGALGVAILYGYRFGWPSLLRERRFFDPVALCLALAALLHFNAIHLVPLAIVLYWREPRRILKIGALTTVGLLPWLATVAIHPKLFWQQMELQFGRLSGYANPWLNTWNEFVAAILNEMGSPEPWSDGYRMAVVACVYALPATLALMVYAVRSRARLVSREGTALLGGFVWFVSAIYLWHHKAEVWFTHFFHLAFWAWGLLVLFEAQRELRVRFLAVPFLAIGLVFAYEQTMQTFRLEQSQSWHWRTYNRWIGCIDEYLTKEFDRLGRPAKFRVWGPNFPDILVELSRKHPNWEFTRTNDFHTRWDLAVRHGHDVEAMVITEIFRSENASFRGELAWKPGARSVWMNWDQYFLKRLEMDPLFKPRRFLCQQGRWDAFIYLNAN